MGDLHRAVVPILVPAMDRITSSAYRPALRVLPGQMAARAASVSAAFAATVATQRPETSSTATPAPASSKATTLDAVA